MHKVIAGMTISLDGYVNDHNGDVSRLYPPRDEIRELEVVKQAIAETGAVLMGRHAYEMAKGDLTGYEFQVPIFVLTHHPPERPPQGENDRLRVHFVDDRIEVAAARARDAAAPRDVMVVGGVDVIHQLLRAGLVDELVLGFAPVLLGGGLRLFGDMEDVGMGLEQLEVIVGRDRTDVRYRVL
jgi:dihydrofolate reductase